MLKLRHERQRRGWSLTDVCAKTGISPTTLSEIERGMRYPYPGWQSKIARAFKMKAADLFCEVEDDER